VASTPVVQTSLSRRLASIRREPSAGISLAVPSRSCSRALSAGPSRPVDSRVTETPPRSPMTCANGITASTRGARPPPSEQPGWSIWTSPVPEGESVQQVGERARRVIDRAEGAGGDVAMFAHAHILRILAACWIGQPPINGRASRAGNGIDQRSGLRARDPSDPGLEPGLAPDPRHRRRIKRAIPSESASSCPSMAA
jgi:hypothetical protein